MEDVFYELAALMFNMAESKRADSLHWILD
jgi:hypothetical protein